MKKSKDSSALTIAFISRRPESAARVLASLQSTDAAAFLQQIPTRYAIKAVTHMNPGAAAAIVQTMHEESAMPLIRDLDFAAAASILRQINPGDRQRLLAGLPRRMRRDFDYSLAFPFDTVGARMTTAITALSENDRVENALDSLRQAERDQDDVVFVINEERRLVGAVTVGTLLRHPAKTSLAELLDVACVSISPYARLTTIAGLDAWHDYSGLPVVSRRGEIIGAISRKALREADGAGKEYAATDASSLADSILGAMVASTAGLVDLLGSSSDAVRRKGEVSGR